MKAEGGQEDPKDQRLEEERPPGGGGGWGALLLWDAVILDLLLAPGAIRK